MAFSTLNIGASALYAAQRAVETAAHNVANAPSTATPASGCRPRRQPPAPGTPGVRGSGMRGNGVTVSVDRLRSTLNDVSCPQRGRPAGCTAARATCSTGRRASSARTATAPRSRSTTS